MRAYFDDLYQRITIEFSVDTEIIGYAAGDFDCDVLFFLSEQFGEISTCKFQNKLTLIIITHSYTATIVPGDTISIKPDIISGPGGLDIQTSTTCNFFFVLKESYFFLHSSFFFLPPPPMSPRTQCPLSLALFLCRALFWEHCLGTFPEDRTFCIASMSSELLCP